MTFAQPDALLGLLLLPLVVACYAWAQQRHRRYPVRYSSVSLVRDAVAQGSAVKRHAPAALYVLTLTALVIAGARPSATLPSPDSAGTVILAIDVSGSMRATDIAPSRIDAAKAAVRAFVSKEPKGIRIGVVAFSSSALLVTPPTEDRKHVLAAVNVLELTRGTNIGEGLQVALDALSSSDGDGPAPLSGRGPSSTAGTASLNAAAATIVLLSDGAATTGPDPLLVARQIAEARIKVHTVGLGTVQRGSFQGPGSSMQLDEATLKGIANATGGEYFSAQDAGQLQQIYGKIARQHQIVRRQTELTFVFGGAGILLLLTGLVLGAAWLSKLP